MTDAWPYTSLVLSATRLDGTPLLLLSGLAQHTQNTTRDPRVSLLFDGTDPGADRLAGARATLLGRAAMTKDPEDRRRFLARHPEAAAYADFGDFSCYRVVVERAHLVAGFGRIHWVEAPEIVLSPGDFPTDDADVVKHMNEDHADAIALYATKLLKLAPGKWQLSGCDAEGCDLILEGRVARLEFSRPVHDLAALRAKFVDLAIVARNLG